MGLVTPQVQTDWHRMLQTPVILLCIIQTCAGIRCLMCASYAGSNPSCEAGVVSPVSGVVSTGCPGSLPWTEGCKVMVFFVPRLGNIWTRGCCGGIFPRCYNSSDHFSVGTSCTTDNCNIMDPTQLEHKK